MNDMRETLFRAKRIDNKQWVTSHDVLTRLDWVNNEKWNNRIFLQDGYSCNRMPEVKDFFEVIPDTLVRSTYLDDKNDNDLWEGDIVKQAIPVDGTSETEEYICTIEWNGWSYGLFMNGKQYWVLDIEAAKACEHLGNKFDNPDLLTTK